ncbi:MAG TPA: helix-turn-helix domain-containing protein [Candidatus Bacteroides intestinigallinarum]|nr:helix-turn-helix domain-containing protein [Candidatus Bacteroides intestinigallinarum]HJH47456.1 helix-turn-helix domain-containing protein [Bacteroides fragilis]
MLRIKRGEKLNISECNEPVATGTRHIIAQKGLKNIYVAERAGFTPQELSDMLNGRRLIKACDIPKLARAMEVKESDIYEAGKKGE